MKDLHAQNPNGPVGSWVFSHTWNSTYEANAPITAETALNTHPLPLETKQEQEEEEGDGHEPERLEQQEVGQEGPDHDDGLPRFGTDP